MNKNRILKALASTAITLMLLAVSFALSVLLFTTILDNFLLWQFEGAFINVVLRLLLAFFIFMVLSGLLKGALPKYLIWILGFTYILIILYVILLKPSFVRGLNLNPLTLFNDIVYIPFYPIANFISFIPIGIFVRYLSPNAKFRFQVVGGFLGSIVIEIIQYIFNLGVTDINDVITNGCGIVVGVWLFKLAYKNEKIRKIVLPRRDRTT